MWSDGGVNVTAQHCSETEKKQTSYHSRHHRKFNRSFVNRLLNTAARQRTTKWAALINDTAVATTDFFYFCEQVALKP